MRTPKRSIRIRDSINVPMVEIFGGAFGLLLILLVLMNAITDNEITAMLDDASEESAYRISWENGSEGFVVLTFADHLQILQQNTSVAPDKICLPNSAFVNYIRQIYSKQTSQLIFAITEGGVGTMAIARNCMLAVLGRQPIVIGWIIANEQLLKAINLDEIPAEVKRSIRTTILHDPSQ